MVRQTTGFARIPDAGRVAFAVVGSGPAIMLPAWWVSHLAEDWQYGPFRRFVEGLAAGRTVGAMTGPGPACPTGSGRTGRSPRSSR